MNTKTKKKSDKIGSVVIDNGIEKKRATPFEDMFSLASMLRIAKSGRRIGSYLKTKGEKDIQAVFGFECEGLHPTMRPESVEPTFNILEAALKDMSQREDLAIHLQSFVDDRTRQAELFQLTRQTDFASLKYLTMSEAHRVAELSKMGVRKRKTLTFYCTYTLTTSEKMSDPIQKFLYQVEKKWKGFTGVLEEDELIELQDFIQDAFTEGFLLWEQLFANKMGLSIRPLSEEDLWSKLWHRFNRTEPKSIPQLLIFDENGLSEEIHSEVHPVSLLMESSIPVADHEWVHVNGKYLGVMVLADKPAGWDSLGAQLRYLWESLAKDRVFDTEIIFQMTTGNQSVLFTKMQSLTKQAVVSELIAERQKTVDVSAALKKESSVAAQKEMHTGGLSFKVGLVALIHRDTLEQLDEACKHYSSLFLRPAWVMRETEYTWLIWLQTFPIYWGRLMAKPFERRHTFLTKDVLGFMPIVKNRSLDKSGVELIAFEGGCPVHIDLYDQHKHILLLGTQRTGKSALACQKITLALAHGIPVVAVDYPKPDGTGTFSDYAKFLGKEIAEYFNISSESANLFEPPDLSSLEPKLQEERFIEYKEFLVNILQMMVLGIHHRAIHINPDTVLSLLSLAVNKFFEEPVIHRRYVEAFKAGIGTTPSQKIPTLVDFERFLSLERLELLDPTQEKITALEHIKLRLRFWLDTRVGKAISRPSTIRNNAQFLCCALTNLSNDEDAAILAANFQLWGLRQAMSAPACIFYIDEIPILFEYEDLANLVARSCANGGKSGIRVILSAQDPDTIARHKSSSKILQNLTTRITGRIQPAAIDSFERILKYPKEIISVNATEAFFPSKKGIYSNWLIEEMGQFTFARFYPGYGLLATCANNPDEAALRQKILQQHSDPIIGMNAFAKELTLRFRTST